MKKVLIPFLLLVFLLSACGPKEEPFNAATGLEMTQDNKIFQDNFSFLNNTIDSEADEGDGSWKMGSFKTLDTIVGVTQCVSVSYHPTSEVKTLHFGLDSLTGEYADCECNDGRLRKGKVQLVFSGNYFLEGATTTAELEDFYLDGYPVEGRAIITNLASNSEGHPQRSVDVFDAQLSAPDGSWTHTWWRSQTLEMIGGVSTIFWPYDNVFKISETGGGIGRAGVAYEYNTSMPILVRWNCIALIVDGVVDLRTADGTEIASLDFDPIGEYDETGVTQECDIKFSITTADGELHRFFY